MEGFKCFLITMGIGFALGAVVASSNKKVADIAKQAKQMAEEKFDMVKEGAMAIKEKIDEKIEEKKDQSEEDSLNESTKNKKQTKKA